MLAFLRARLREDDLIPTVEGIDYMIRLGVDPVSTLQYSGPDLKICEMRWKRLATRIQK